MGNLEVNLHLCPLTIFMVVFFFSSLICNDPNIIYMVINYLSYMFNFHLFFLTVLHVCIVKQQKFRKLFGL